MSKLYLWDGDLRHPLPEYIQAIAPYCTSLVTCTEYIDELREMGYEAYFLPSGVDTATFNKNVLPEQGGDIVFQGGNYEGFELSGERFKLMRELKKEFKGQFKIYGNGWHEFGDGHTMGNPDKECAIYRGAKIAINFSNYRRGRYTSDRMYRIMGSGCFCLSHWYPDYEKDFPNLVTFETPKECIKLIKYYLKHEEERQANADLHYNLVHDRHKWVDRMSEFLKIG